MATSSDAISRDLNDARYSSDIRVGGPPWPSLASAWDG